jgi:hypothetical protein
VKPRPWEASTTLGDRLGHAVRGLHLAADVYAAHSIRRRLRMQRAWQALPEKYADKSLDDHGTNRAQEQDIRDDEPEHE